MNDAQTIGQILWSSDPATQRAIWFVLVASLVAAATVYVPLILRLVRLGLLERELRELADELTPSSSSSSANSLLDDFKAMLVASSIQSTYEEFERRWATAQVTEEVGRAPVRLMDILDERPLLAFGPRRSLMPALPGLLFGAAALAALSGLIPSLSEASRQGMTAEANSAWMAAQLGLALRAATWGFVCAIGASLTGRLIEGSFDARSHGLDEVIETAFGSISPGELAELTRRTQQSSLSTLGRELTRFSNELNERLDRGLQRIEQSTARSASLVSQEQRGALHTIVGELSLSIRQGVEHHLGELRGALQRAVEHQDSVAGGLAETFQIMVENSRTQDRVARSLDASARSVEEAALAMQGQATEMHPVLEHLGATSDALSKTADRIGDTQQVVARTAEGVRGALEHAASGVDDQRRFIALTLTEIREAIVGLSDGLGDSLQRSLREVDDALSGSVSVFKDTLAEGNESIDRLSSPIRAAEGSTREIHLALDRVRGEIEVLAQWMNQASKPLRAGLADVDGRAEEITRAMTEFNNHARQIDKTMEALRHEIHEESTRIQGVSSELGRRLQQTSDAVGLLESTTSDAARRSRPDPDAARPRERVWAPRNRDAEERDSDFAPSASAPGSSPRSDPRESRISDAEPTFSPTPTPAPSNTSRTTSKTSTSKTSTPKTATPETTPPEATPRRFGSEGASQDDSSGAETDSGSSTTLPGFEPRSTTAAPPRDFAGSTYRVGSPKAQGPDPYQRFDQTDEAPSNVRHFPTPERELSPDLKLSGLLGPRSEDDGAEDRTKSTTAKTPGERGKGSRRHKDDPPSSDDDRDA